MASEKYLWVEKGDNTTRIGLTSAGQEALGKVKFIDLPVVGREIKVGDSTGEVEAQKAVIEFESPVSGTIVKVNDKLTDNPELLNGSEKDAWLFEVNN
ncbi:glycine cleavage system protein H [Companilactobacillus hulinensis]|uniref:glycine cleavage system protein H n=1 Tax=Companilactobacillus hulinensis TaxID=2486007 RepID=UPI000F7B3C31|nr:glycine cleavage system protein H [Companilactobacillus hulinensis]